MTKGATFLRDGGVLRLAWNLGYITVGVAVAAGLAWPIYQSNRMILVCAVAAVLGAGIVVLARFRGWRWWITAAVSLGVYLLVVVPLAIPSALTSPLRVARGVFDALLGIVLGWKQLLTLSLPVGEYQGVLVPLFVTIFVGTIAATAFSFSQRAIGGLAVPSVLLMSAFGLVFGSSTTDAPLSVAWLSIPAPRQVLLGTLILLVSLVWQVGRSRMARASALRRAQSLSKAVRQSSRASIGVRLRRRVFAVVLVLVAISAGLLVAPAAQGWAPREVLRDRIDPLLVVLQQPSPLSDYRSWFTSDSVDDVMFRIEGNLTGIDRVRIATLGYYDGAVFRPGTRDGAQSFTRLPSASHAGSQLKVTIGPGYSGVWVPLPGITGSAPVFGGELAEKLADSFYLSTAGESAVDVMPRNDGGYGIRPGDSYQLFVMPTPTETTLGSSSGGKALISDEEYPALAAWVEQQEVPRTGAGLMELLTRLKDRGYLSHSLQESDQSRLWIERLSSADYVFQPSYAGHSTARVEELFTALYDQERSVGPDASKEALVAAIGDDEQFATAGALLARFLGFDSRVIVGAKLSSHEVSPSVAPCESGTCKGANVTAWVEIRSPNGGWVTADVSPQFVLSPFRVTPGEERPQNPTVAQEVNTEVLDPPPAQRDDSAEADARDSPAPGWLDAVLPILLVVGTGLLTVFLLLLPLLFLVALKSLRRRRRRSAPVPEVSLVGAWDELIDTYVDYGLDVPTAATRDLTARTVGRQRAHELAVLCDAAVFAEHPPLRQDSEAAWALVDLERKEFAGESRLRDRVTAALSLRSVLRYLPDRATLVTGLSLFRPKEIT